MISKARLLIVGIVVVIALVGGLSVPLFLDFRSPELTFDRGGVVAAPRDEFTIATPIVLSRDLNASVSYGRLLQALPADGGMTGAEATALLQSGEAELVLDSVDLNIGGPSIDDFSVPHAAKAFSVAPIAKALKEGSFSTLVVRNSRIAIVLPGGHRARLFNANLTVERTSRNTITANGRAVWRGQDVKLLIKVGRARKPGKPFALEAKIDGKLIKLDFKGKIATGASPRLEGATELAIADLKALTHYGGLGWSENVASLQKVLLKGPMIWSDDAISFPKAQASLNGNAGVGTLAFKNNAAQPRLTGTIAFDLLDVSSFLTVGKQSAAWPAQQIWQAISSAWSVPWTRQIEADLRLSAKQTLLGETELGKSAATIAVADGKLSAQLAKIAYDGGSGSGQLTIDFNGILPLTTLRGKLDNAPLGDISRALTGRRSIEGRATLTADLSAYGVHFQPMLESLSGDLHLTSVDGGTLGIDMWTLLNIETNAAPVRADELLRTATQGTTSVESLDASVKLESGRIIIDGCKAVINDSVAHLTGRLELAGRWLGLRTLVYPKPKTNAATSKPGQSKAVAAKLLAVHGSWDRPLIESTAVSGLPAELLIEARKPVARNGRDRAQR